MSYSGCQVIIIMEAALLLWYPLLGHASCILGHRSKLILLHLIISCQYHKKGFLQVPLPPQLTCMQRMFLLAEKSRALSLFFSVPIQTKALQKRRDTSYGWVYLGSLLDLCCTNLFPAVEILYYRWLKRQKDSVMLPGLQWIFRTDN